MFFLSDSGGSTFVYKPHALSADYAFYSLLEYFNTLLTSRKERVLPPLLFPAAPRLYPDWGVETFLRRVDEPLTDGEAKAYYAQMGALFFLTKLLGMTDAHQDNLIPTPNGPVLIDAECAFQPQVMTAPRLSATGLFAALTQSNSPAGEYTASALFHVGADYSIQVYRRYRMDILRGFQQARILLTADLPALTRFISTLWESVTQIRVLPLDTSALKALSLSVRPDLEQEDFLALPEVKTVIQFLNGLLPGGVSIRPDALYAGMGEALRQMEIPYFCFRREDSSWGLYSEYQLLAKASPFDRRRLDVCVHDNLAWLCSEAPMEELQRALDAPPGRGASNSSSSSSRAAEGGHGT